MLGTQLSLLERVQTTPLRQLIGNVPLPNALLAEGKYEEAATLGIRCAEHYGTPAEGRVTVGGLEYLVQVDFYAIRSALRHIAMPRRDELFARLLATPCIVDGDDDRLTSVVLARKGFLLSATVAYRRERAGDLDLSPQLATALLYRLALGDDWHHLCLQLPSVAGQMALFSCQQHYQAEPSEVRTLINERVDEIIASGEAWEEERAEVKWLIGHVAKDTYGIEPPELTPNRLRAAVATRANLLMEEIDRGGDYDGLLAYERPEIKKMIDESL